MGDTWGAHLGAPQQWRNVPYVQDRGDGFVICLLCRTGEMHKSICGRHFSGSLHQKTYRKVKENYREAQLQAQKRSAIVSRVEEVRSEQINIESLGLQAWRDDIKARMLDRILTPRSPKILCEYLEAKEISLKKYLKMEKSSLLELALWKAKIIDWPSFSDVKSAREHLRLDNAKDYFNRARLRCGCGEIIPLVMTFVGNHD